MKRLFPLTILLLVILPWSILAQSTTAPKKKKKQKPFLMVEADRKTFERGEYFFNEKSYSLALQEYKKLEIDYPDEEVVLFRIGVCYINMNGDKSRSLDYLIRLNPHKFKKTDLLFYLARANHLNYNFDQAMLMYSQFLNSKHGKGKEKLIAHLIQNCQNGKDLYASPGPAQIINLGPPVNTEDAEYSPTVSSDESSMIFTYSGPRSQGGLQSEPGVPSEAGQYFEDIFETHKDSVGKWTKPEPINSINTNGPDAAISLSNDGQKLFVFKNTTGEGGDIYLSKLEGATWTEPEPLRGEVNTEAWEGSASLSADEQTLYFSSERPGGYGGRDLYSATLQPDGSWAQVKNLGPKINTEYNDDSPVIHPDGISLYFQSEGHNSMGGNDIFVSMLVNDSVWQDPVNLGYPINTPDDDVFFFPGSGGNRGYYSSGKAGGQGQQDIYLVDGLARKSRLVMVKGVVTIDDKPVEASITIADEKKGTELHHHSNSVSGKYLVNLKPDKNFKIKFKAQGFDEQVKSLNTMKVDSFLESTIDVQFYTEGYKARLKRIQDSLGLRKDTAMSHGGQKISLAEMIAKYGDVKLEDLEFRVQIGAFSLGDGFNYSALLKLGKVQRNKSDDAITRFTVGHCHTLNEVYVMKKKVIASGIKDAFVTAVYKKKRMLLKDLLSNNIYETK
jgi:hypothetical protein